MPTPSGDTVPPTPPEGTTSSRASFASCPPDDERHAHLDERLVLPLPGDGHNSMETEEEEHMTIAQELTPEPESDTQEGVSREIRSRQRGDKGEHVEDEGVAEDSPSTVASPDAATESVASRLAQSLSTAAISPSDADEPMYLTFPRDKTRISPSITSSFLRPGSKFRGTQQSDRQVYDVQVEIKDVNMAESFLCGYLRIQGLTDDHPTLTTFFEGEIIGPKHLFRTTHPSWGSSERVDNLHWNRFPAWRPLAKAAKASSKFTLKNYAQREHLFMRWKEYFLVPDHQVKTITGASFEGFYYICFNQVEGSVSGIYFHAKSEKYQQLELKHVDDRGCMGAMEFR